MSRFVTVCGVDEAGRGPLAGPVVAAAVILPAKQPISGLKDSKQLTSAHREMLYDQIVTQATAFAIVSVDVDEIDQLNILQATLIGMQRAVLQLPVAPSQVLIDGNKAPALPYPCRTIVGGDALEAAISAASILAKVSRDRYMQTQHQHFPHYGFDRNKGYPTPGHLQALKEHGPCELHRRSFAPVRDSLQAGLSL